MWQDDGVAEKCPRCGGPLGDAIPERRRDIHPGYATRKEAEHARTETLRRLDTGSYVDPSKLTFGEYLTDEWLPARRPKQGTGRGHRGQVALHTWQVYADDLGRYVLPKLGSVQLQALRPAHLNGLYDELETTGGRSGTGLAAKTVANVHGLVHKALADALKQGLVVRNVADAVDPPRPERARTDVWTVGQLRQFLAEVADDRLYAAWLLLATTGMRRGEVAGLVWGDVDLDAATVTLDWTLGEVRGKPTWKPRPKTDAGRRTMSLDPTTVEALRAHRHRQNEERLAAGPAWHERAYDWRGEYREAVVFAWPDGTLTPPDRFTRWFHGHREAAGLPRIRLHDVRHTYATAGLSHATGWHEVKVVSERLGHASVGMTVDTYAHVLPARDRETADTLARLILGDSGTGVG